MECDKATSRFFESGGDVSVLEAAVKTSSEVWSCLHFVKDQPCNTLTVVQRLWNYTSESRSRCADSRSLFDKLSERQMMMATYPSPGQS